MGLLATLLERADPAEGRALGPTNLAWDRGDTLNAFNETVGVPVNRDTMLGVSAVWACVSLIADSVATLPIYACKDDSDGTPRRLGMPPWLTQPNPEQTLTDFKFGTVASLLLHGNAYIYLVRDRKQNIVEAWLLDPRWVYVRREFRADGTLGLNYYVSVGKGMQSPVGPFIVPAGPDMFHIMAFQPNSSWPMGIAPLDVAQMMFGSAIAGQQMGARWFGSGFNAAGVLETEADLTPDQAQTVKRDFTDANSGVRKMHLPPVLSGGLTWKQIQISPEQAQFLEQRQFSVDEVARWFRVPPHMIGNLEKTSSWGAGIEQQSIGFGTYTLRPWMKRIEDSWSRNMLTFQPGAYFRFDMTDLLRGDMAAMGDFMVKSHMVGAYSANELRAKFLGEPPFDGGETHYFPVNTAPVGTDPITLLKTKVDIGQPAPVAGGVDEGPQGEKNELVENLEARLAAYDRAWAALEPAPTNGHNPT
jgi:HK97 family phage portal protein